MEQLNTGATRTLAVVTDVTKEADTDHLFASVKDTFGRAADVVFANAGILPDNLPLAEENVRSWWSALVSSDDIGEGCTGHMLISC